MLSPLVMRTVHFWELYLCRIYQRISLISTHNSMFHNKWIKRFVIFLGVLGPSVVTTMAGNDGAGVITYSYAGAKLGYAALFTLPILTILYGVTQEMGSRIAIVSGKGLGDVIREKFGVRIAMVIFALILIANFGTIVTDIAALKVSSQMLGLPSLPFIVLTIAFCFLLVTFAEYEKSQKLFLTGMVFYFAYLFSAIKGNPDWIKSVTSLFVPPSNLLTKDYIVI